MHMFWCACGTCTHNRNICKYNETLSRTNILNVICFRIHTRWYYTALSTNAARQKRLINSGRAYKTCDAGKRYSKNTSRFTLTLPHQVFFVKTGIFGFASACVGIRFFALLIDTRPPATLLLSVSLFSVCQRTSEDCLCRYDTFFFTVQCEDMFPMPFYEHEQSHQIISLLFRLHRSRPFFQRLAPLPLWTLNTTFYSKRCENIAFATFSPNFPSLQS